MSEDQIVETGPKMAKRVTGIESTAALTVLAESNPKREGSQSYERFEAYFTLEDDATVADAIEAGLTMGDIRYDVIHGSIKVEGANVEEYEVTPRGESSEKAEVDTEADVDTDVDTDGNDSGF